VAKSYRSQYLDPRWQKKRLEVMESTSFKCESCDSETNTLNVHHKQYIPNRDVWDYRRDQFLVLCEDCHEAYHSEFDWLNEVIGSVDPKNLSRKGMAAFLAGWAGVEIDLDEFSDLHQYIFRQGQSFAYQSDALIDLYEKVRRGKK
jgi:hypothetical protein